MEPITSRELAWQFVFPANSRSKDPHANDDILGRSGLSALLKPVQTGFAVAAARALQDHHPNHLQHRPF